ncbi:MAG: carboxylesterase family protein [Terracidiphilus sp.]
MFPPASFFGSHWVSAAKLILAIAAFALFANPLPVLAQNSAASARNAAAPSQNDPLVVRTTAGLIRGIARSNGGAQFLGIPYAERPVGRLRWRAPLPKKSWSGIRDGNAFGSSCPQPLLGGAWNRYDAEHSSEDCLYLNVNTPAWPAAKPLPVMFWIHGGANIGGSGSGSLYNDGTLLSHGILLVTINYRLGILGYLAHPELTSESPHHDSGNYGLMDQILALRWVHDNIARFGGDPNNVTVFGQSDGAKDTGILMTSLLASGLFQKAIAESGSPFYPPLTTLDQGEQAGQKFAASFPVLEGRNPIEFLRQVPVQDVIAKAAILQWGQPPVSPIVDGWVVPHSPEDVFKAGNEAPIPLLLGITTREFGGAESADPLRKSIEAYAGNFASQALALYGLANGGEGVNDPLYGSAGVQWNADVEFHCPVSTEALWHTAAHQPVFEYEFDRAIPGQEAQGALHSGELPYVFGSYPASGNIGGNYGPVDTHLADLIESYWTNFAETGDPNGKGDRNSASLPHWPELDGASLYLIFNEDGQAVASTGPLRAPQCNLYREILAVRMKQPQ